MFTGVLFQCFILNVQYMQSVHMLINIRFEQEETTNSTKLSTSH